jgi:hypothetical protein
VGGVLGISSVPCSASLASCETHRDNDNEVHQHIGSAANNDGTGDDAARVIHFWPKLIML